MRYFYLTTLILIFSTIYSSAQNFNKPDANKKQIAPDICIVQAKVVKITPARKKISKQSCKKSPCLATIEILKVEKTGRTFPEKFYEGQKIKVKFLSSLKTTNQLPGLKKKDTFKAVIKAKPEKNSNSSIFFINSYKKL